MIAHATSTTREVSPVAVTVAAPQKLELPDLDLSEMPLQAMPGLGIEGLDEARHAELVDALGEDVFQELVESFFDDATSLMDELNDALRKNDPGKIDRVLHTIKGAASNVGLNDIAVKANALRSQTPAPADIETFGEEILALKFKLVA